MKRSFLPYIFAAVLITTGVTSASAHRVRDCEIEIGAAVENLGIERRSVRDIAVWHESAAGGEGGRQGYLAYVTLETCEGYLMVATAASCHVLQVYTSGSCAVPGVSHYV